MAGRNSSKTPSPADLVVGQLKSMDSDAYITPDISPDADPKEPVQQERRQSPAKLKTPKKDSLKEKDDHSGRRYVQMYISPEIYAHLKMAKAAFLFATGKDISAGTLVGLLLEKGLQAVDAKTAKKFRKLLEEE